MQRMLKKKAEPNAKPKTHAHAHAHSSSSSAGASTSARRHYAPAQPPQQTDQVVVGLAASREDDVEDWSDDFLELTRGDAAASAPAVPPTPSSARWRRQEDALGERLRALQTQRRGSSASGSSATWRPADSRQSAEDSEDEDPHGFWSSFSTLKDVRVGRPAPPSVSSSNSSSSSDWDWDAEFLDDAADPAANNLDPTRRRAENGNFFLPNLHEVLDGESLPDDDSDDFSSSRRPRRSSDEPLFQRRRSDLQPSDASVTSAGSGAVELVLADKLRLLELAGSAPYAVRIERYPKPSTAFSAGFSTLQENQYEHWLASLITPRCAVVARHMEQERQRRPPPRQLQTQTHQALVGLPFGREFLRRFFRQAALARFLGEEKPNRELIRTFFDKVSAAGMPDAHWAAALPATEFQEVVGCSMELLQEAARLYGPKSLTTPATHLSLSMLSTTSTASEKASLYWMQQFQTLLLHCAEAFPSHRYVVALVELRYVCHHLASLASGELTYVWQLCHHLPAFAPLEPLASDSAAKVVNEVLQFYGALFRQLNTSPESRSRRYTTSSSVHEPPISDSRHFALSPDAVCLQALILCDIQSLYDSKSALAEESLPALEELFEFEDDEAVVDPLLVGLLPHGRDSRSSSASSTSEQRDSGSSDGTKGLGGWSNGVKLVELLRPASRTRLSALTFFYERISASAFPLVKAKCAATLAGMHASATSLSSLRVAESLGYEALRLLESCSSRRVTQLASSDGGQAAPCYLSVFINDGLLSGLGREVLESMGTILIKNQKYRYGILCLEAAGELYSFLHQGEAYEKLDRSMCKLTLEADDVQRALPLHEKVTSAAQRHGNINVYVYLTQELTKLWIREGNFTRAEEFLATACHFLRDHTTLLPPFFLSSVTSASYSSNDAASTRSGTMMTATSSSASSSLSGSFHLSSRSTGNSTEMDTWLNHDITLHLLVRDVYRSSGRCLEGMRVLEHLLNYSPRLPRGKRTQLRMLLAEDALKMRMFDTCRHMFVQLERDAATFCDRLQENIQGFSGLGSSSGSGHGAGGSSNGGRSLGGMNSETRCCFDMVLSLRYVTCRAKTYLKLGEYCHAFAWLSLAHVKSDSDNVRSQAQLHVLDGKVLRAFWRDRQEREQREQDGPELASRHPASATFVGSVLSPQQIEELLKPLSGSMYGLNHEEKERLHARMLLLGECVRNLDKTQEQMEQAFWTAFDLYHVLDDSLYKLKVLLEILDFSLAPIARAFFALGSDQDDEMLKAHLHRRSSGKGSSVLDTEEPAILLGGDDTIEKTRKSLLEAQKLLRPALNLAEQVAEPASFLRTLLFCSQVWVWLERIASYKSEKHLKEATAFWEEAVRVMKAVFFRRVAFQDVSDPRMPYASIGFGRDFLPPYVHGGGKGRFCVVPILNFSEGFILKLEAMTLQLILTACQLQMFERIPEYVEDTLLQHLDELMSARMCLSSIAHQLQAFRALQRSHKRLPPSGSASTLSAANAACAAGLPSGSSVSSVGSSGSRSSSFSTSLPTPVTQTGGGSAKTVSPSGGIASGKRAGGHKKNQSMSSISELLASNAPPPSPFQDSKATLVASGALTGGGLKNSATPRTGLASLSERPNAPPVVTVKTLATHGDGHEAKKTGSRRPRTRERSRSAPQPALAPSHLSPSAAGATFSRSGDGGAMPVVAEAVESSDGSRAMKRTSSVKFIDLGDLRSWPSGGAGFGLRDEDGFVREEGSSSNGAIGLCDFDEVQSEKLWWIFNLWRDAKAKYVGGKIETGELRSRNLRYLRTLLDAFDPTQIAVLYSGGGLASPSSDGATTTPSGSTATGTTAAGRVANPSGMLDFDVAHMNSHALIQDGALVLSIGYYAVPGAAPFESTTKLRFKVFATREGETKTWRQEIPRPEWYLSDYDQMEAEEGAVGLGVLRTMRVLGAKFTVKLLGLLLLEHAVVVVGSSYPQIKEVTLSLLKLLEPFRWQHTFLPFVPVASWRFLHDAASLYAQTEAAARPKSRKSFSRLSHEWRWGSSASDDSSTDSGANATAADTEDEPPFLMGATSETWQSCLAFAQSSGGEARALTACVTVVDLDDVAALASDKPMRNALPLPRKWRKQFLERMEKAAKQRRKAQLKMSRRHSAQQLVGSRVGATTPASSQATTPQSQSQSLRSPVDSYRPMDTSLRNFDDALSSSRSGSSWMLTPASGAGTGINPGSDVGSNYTLLSSGVHSSSKGDAAGLEDRLFYDSVCATTFVSGLREFYDKLLGLCAEKDRKLAKSGKKKRTSSGSGGHSKRQEIRSWFSSSHDFDAFVDRFGTTALYAAYEKDKQAAQTEAQTQAKALQSAQESQEPQERRSSEQELGSSSSGRSAALIAMIATTGTTPGSLANSFATQQLKSFGSLSSMSTSNNSLGGSGGHDRKW